MNELMSAIEDVARADSLLVAADFDGTLSLPVDDPRAAELHPRAAGALDVLRMCAKTHLLVVSGRGLDDLRGRFATLPQIDLIGSHGNEREPGYIVGSTRLHRLSNVLRGIASHIDGAWVEEKPLSLALHFRAVSVERRAELRRMLDAFIPPSAAKRVIIGRDTAEYLFADGDKGSAVRAVVQRLSPTTALFIGDDATDEAAFAALRPGDLGIKIGPEQSIAAYHVRNIEDALDALEFLARRRAAHAR